MVTLMRSIAQLLGDVHVKSFVLIVVTWCFMVYLSQHDILFIILLSGIHIAFDILFFNNTKLVHGTNLDLSVCYLSTAFLCFENGIVVPVMSV